MVATSIVRTADILGALEELSDEELHIVISRAQCLLLDRPTPPNRTPELAVEVVGTEESRLLAAYRALAPLAQRRLLGHVLHLVRAPQRLARRQRATAASV